MKEINFSAMAAVNPIGHGMQLCLEVMKDSKEKGDMVTYNKWLAMGLKYVDLQMKHEKSAMSISSIKTSCMAVLAMSSI